MKLQAFSRIRPGYLHAYLFIFFSLLCSFTSRAQAPANFSGVWLQDTIKSDAFYKAAIVTYTITQTAQTFTVKQDFTIKAANETVTRNYSFSLDGKVTTNETENGKEKNSAQWSADKKTLTTRTTTLYGNQDVGFTESYTLSGNGMVLTTVKSDIIPGATTVKQVFNKKK